jgi:hypothetical protein
MIAQTTGLVPSTAPPKPNPGISPRNKKTIPTSPILLIIFPPSINALGKSQQTYGPICRGAMLRAQ